MKPLIKTILFAVGLSMATSAIASNYMMRVMIPGEPVVSCPLRLSGVSPAIVPLSGGTVTVAGQCLGSSDTVEINGVKVPFSLASPAQMSVTAPSVSSSGYASLTVSGASKPLGLIYEGSTSATVAGAYGGGDWGDFPGWPAAADSADWLYANGSWASAPASPVDPTPANIETNSVTVTGSYVYDNTTGADIQATLYATGDNEFVALLNGQQVLYGDNWDATYSGPITLKPGNNLLQVESLNYGTTNNPAGLIAAVLGSNGSVLFETNSSWTVGPASTD